MRLADPTPLRAAQLFAEFGRECERVCLETAQHCQFTGGDSAQAPVLRDFFACARVSQMSRVSLTLGSELTQPLLLACHAACVNVTRACAALLGAVGEDEHLESCATACLDCAAACETLLETEFPDPCVAGRAWRIRISTDEALTRATRV